VFPHQSFFMITQILRTPTNVWGDPSQSLKMTETHHGKSPTPKLNRLCVWPKWPLPPPLSLVVGECLVCHPKASPTSATQPTSFHVACIPTRPESSWSSPSLHGAVGGNTLAGCWRSLWTTHQRWQRTAPPHRCSGWLPLCGQPWKGGRQQYSPRARLLKLIKELAGHHRRPTATLCGTLCQLFFAWYAMHACVVCALVWCDWTWLLFIHIFKIFCVRKEGWKFKYG
jgi:hypothetical protein